MTKVIVVNGPNLGRLGVRQPDVYGRQDLETLRTQCSQWGAALGLKVEVRQTDRPHSRITRTRWPTPRTWWAMPDCR